MAFIFCIIGIAFSIMQKTKIAQKNEFIKKTQF